jgi:Fatty acid desaturase
VIGTLVGLLVWMPYRGWQHEHAVHHATAGNLDRRGTGDITTLTVAEYNALPLWRRVGYRLFRNPFVMFGFGWLLVLVVKPRFVPRGSRPKVRNSILATNVALAVIVTGALPHDRVAGVPAGAGAGVRGDGRRRHLALLRAAPVRGHLLAEQAEWRYDHAALEGSSYLELPAVFRFFTGNIGFHHVHHLSVAIPNYNLKAAHEQTDGLNTVPVLTVREALRATRLKLWDERRGRLVTFADARA